MASERNQSWKKVLLINDVFHQDDYVILTLPNQQFPMKFHPRIHEVEKNQLGLKLPRRWWQFMDFQQGTLVRLTKLHHEGVFFISGSVTQVNYHQWPNIRIRHDGAIKRDQRRFFYRVSMDNDVEIKDLLLPEGQRIMNCPGILYDVSAGGVGLGIKTFLPPGTNLHISNIFAPLLNEDNEKSYELQVVWCRVQRGGGYRLGACFIYPDNKAQDEMVAMINQIQRIKMIKYYHIRNPMA